MSYSFYIDPIYNDFRVSDNQLGLVRGADTIAQQIKIAILAEIGSWFLDVNFGLPWISATGLTNNNQDNGILGSNYPDSLIQTYVSRVVLSIPGVLTINDFVITRNRSNKSLSISIKVIVEESETNGIGTEKTINVVFGGN